MSDIFISYAREDEPSAARLAGALRDAGYSVWWDRKIPPGRSFDEVIEAALDAARCVLVLWSRNSVASRWVRNEAAAALERDCLIPISLDDVPAPLAFRDIQSVQLAGWKGSARHPELQFLLQTLGDRIPVPGARWQDRSGDGLSQRVALRPRVRWRERLRRELTVPDKALQRLIVFEIVSMWSFLLPFAYPSDTVATSLILISILLIIASMTCLVVASCARRYWRGVVIALSPLLLYLSVLLLEPVIPRKSFDGMAVLLGFLTLAVVTHIGFNEWMKLRAWDDSRSNQLASGSAPANVGSGADY